MPFAASYSRALRYARSNADLLRSQLAAEAKADPAHLEPGSTLRQVLADALDDEDRGEEATHMRSQLPLATDHNGQVLRSTPKLHRILTQMDHYKSRDQHLGAGKPSPLRLELAKELERLGRHHEAAIARSQHPISTKGGKVVGGYPRFQWPGGGELVYHTKRGYEPFCADCANGEKGSEALSADLTDDDHDWQLDHQHPTVHEEGPPEYCSHCNRPIEALYGDPDEPDEDR